MARFRPFGRRPDGPDAHEPDPWLDDPPPRGARDARDAGVVDPAPATRAASPALWAPRPAEPVDGVQDVEDVDAPVTDPFGFPPVPPLPGADPAPTWAAWVPERDPGFGPVAASPSRGPLEEPPRPSDGRPDAGSNGTAPPPSVAVPAPVDVSEAAALAGAFAADYLSWDEDDPSRRGRALTDHLPGPDADHALLGWSGSGRQRAEIVLPGAVRPDGDGRLLVDVRVRVTPYRRVSRSEATPEPDPHDALGTPAAAPPVTARGWRGLAARWVRLGVTVVRDGDRLVVDAGEETFEEPDREPGPPAPTQAGPVRAPDDPTLDGDEVASTGRRR